MKTKASQRIELKKDQHRLPGKEVVKKAATRITVQKRTAGPALVRTGLAGTNEFLLLKKLSDLSAEALASLLGITTRTLQNKKSGKLHFNLPLTERLRKLIQLFQLGTDLLGSNHEFSSWLQQPAYGLDYAVPLDLLKIPGGLDRVMDELSAIKYGDTV